MCPYVVNASIGTFVNSGSKEIEASWKARHGNVILSCRSLEDLFEGKLSCTTFDVSTGELDQIIFSISVDLANYVTIEQFPIKSYQVGDMDGGYARTVYVVKFPADFPLRAGLTVHDTRGSWSSYPLHKFEQEALLNKPVDLYPRFAEVFGYVTDPPNSWGIQCGLGNENGTALRFIKDRDIVYIPISNHPIVAAPGVRMAYFWAYVNGAEKFTDSERV